MTENNNTVWEEEQILASDVWAVAKSLTAMSGEDELEAWRKTVKVLDNLCGMADGLVLDPLILALTDAKVRAEEELARARDRLSRPEGEKVHPRERERFEELIRRCDALDAAYWTVVEEDWHNVEKNVSVLAALQEMRGEAHEAFERYRHEVGLED